MLIWIAATILIVGIILVFVLLSRSFVKITVIPANARVEINNLVVPLNTTGYGRATVKPGDNKIEITADGHIGYSTTVSLKGGKTSTYQIELRKDPTPINIGNLEEANNTVQFISPADEDNSMFYLGNNGRTMYKAIFNIDDKGGIVTSLNKPITNPVLSGIKDVIWSPNKAVAIFKKDGGKYTIFDFKKYNFVSQEELNFGENIGDLAWAPDDSKIAYYYSTPEGEKSLIFADKANKEMTRVANLAQEGIDNPFLAWSPNSEWLIVIPRNKDIATNKIYLFNAYTRSFKTVNDSGNNVEAVFNKNGDKIIYSTYSPEPGSAVKQTLSIMDIDGNNKKLINLRAYIPKIMFLNSMESSIIAATYDQEIGKESVFLFNLNTKSEDGIKMNLLPKVYVKEMTLSKDDKILFYIANDKFYGLSLKK